MSYGTLNDWKGEFGNEYTDRNSPDWRKIRPLFQALVGGLEIDTTLEVGCNRGHNLLALQALGHGVKGIEPNERARYLAQSQGLDVVDGDILDIPFPDGFFDLAFTVGVLIHVPPSLLEFALKEMHRVTNRYLVAIEYASEGEEMRTYRGKRDFLWTRDYGREYKTRYKLKDISPKEETWGGRLFPGCRAWVLEKPSRSYRPVSDLQDSQGRYLRSSARKRSSSTAYRTHNLSGTR